MTYTSKRAGRFSLADLFVDKTSEAPRSVPVWNVVRLATPAPGAPRIVSEKEDARTASSDSPSRFKEAA